MSQKFDAKIFNGEAFGKYTRTIPETTKTELLKSGAIKQNSEIYNLFQGQVNSYYGRLPFFGLIGGTPVNYDGKTDITSSSMDTFDRGVLAYGRAMSWTEKDFSHDITSGVEFMDEVGNQVVRFWDKIDQKTLMSVLEGLFGMSTPAQNKAFVDTHTLDVSKNVSTKGRVAEDTLNNAIQQACGDNKGAFSLVIMHSQVATNLENLNLMKRWTQTDKDGITRELAFGNWSGKMVLVDDTMPTKSVAKHGSGDTEIPAGVEYTTYVLGKGAIEFGNLPVLHEFEMDRNPSKNGGEDTLYSRKRHYLGVNGFSYEKKAQNDLSPTDEDLKNPTNWTLINNGTNWIDHKAIPLARIISRG